MPAGAPAKYKTPEEMQKAIDAYFANPPMKTVVSGGYEIDIPVPTVTGLALHLGFESRQSFYDYEKREKFSYTVKRARLKIENEYEIQLRTSSAPTGAIFGLKNMGWADKTELGFDPEKPLKTDMTVTFVDEGQDPE